ncbi:DUF4260 domain-containing protein [Sulfitobacter sp. JB4-11]|uniref:DUF4260 domain-containing protein n=1 Tax=Sulfitobacter rhodophyticola TaxID=3238304 RepID=UPI00351937A3
MRDTTHNPTHPIAYTLQAEGLALGLGALIAFGMTGGSWLMFALLILVPDLAMLGYLAGKRAGALSYNLAHSTLIPWALLGLAYWTASPLMIHLGLIWMAHIGLDRAIGYGLKYASGFKDTHLARV